MWMKRALTEGERAAVAAILDSAGASSLLRTLAGMLELRHPVPACSARYAKRLFRLVQAQTRRARRFGVRHPRSR
jgi:hypothetical protein